MEQNEPSTGEIVRALRCSADDDSFCKKCQYGYALGSAFLCDRGRMNQNASDRLESQAKENEISRHLIEMQSNVITELTARAEQAERERDAAIAEFEEYMLGNEDIPCKYCANHSTDKKCFPYTKSCEPKYNKWRGLPQDGDGV